LPGWITAGPDGAIWFTVSDGIARMTPSGAISLVWSKTNYPYAVTTGPDGNLWFTALYSDEVGRLIPAGHASLFHVATNCTPSDIASGAGAIPDQAVSDLDCVPAGEHGGRASAGAGDADVQVEEQGSRAVPHASPASSVESGTWSSVFRCLRRGGTSLNSSTAPGTATSGSC
jgi:hypothetical protein